MLQHWPGECDSLKESILDFRVARIPELFVVCQIPCLALPGNNYVQRGPWECVWVSASLGTEVIGPDFTDMDFTHSGPVEPYLCAFSSHLILTIISAIVNCPQLQRRN